MITNNCQTKRNFASNNGFLAGRQDGSLHYLNLDDYSENDQIITYLTGSDCDPINDIVFDGERFIHTACRDGKIRKYSFDSLRLN